MRNINWDAFCEYPDLLRYYSLLTEKEAEREHDLSHYSRLRNQQSDEEKDAEEAFLTHSTTQEEVMQLRKCAIYTGRIPKTLQYYARTHI